MKIVIGGAGAVGSHLAKLLSRENHDIILIDEDSTRLRLLESSYDISTIVGSPTSLSILHEAVNDEVDMFVAVTSYESRNLNAAIFAHQLGAKQTIARVDNEEFIEPKNIELFHKLGIDKIVYPEKLASQEVVTTIEKSWVRQWIEFHDGALLVIGVKVRSGAPIVGQMLMELKDSQHYRLVAIRRDEETIIPGGQTKVCAGDVVYFITTKEYLEDVQKQAGKQVISVKDLMVMGGGRIALSAVDELNRKGVNIKVFEKDEKKVARLNEQLDGVMVLKGDATDVELLKEEMIEDVDAFVALTDNSEANILACLSAKRFGVQKIVAEVENIEYIPLAEKMDIGMVINKMEIAASYIYRFTLGADVKKLKKLTFADAEIVELTVAEGSSITKGYVKDLRLPDNMFIGGLVRNGVGHVVSGMTEINAGDKVIVFCLRSSIQNIRKLFE